MNQPTLSIIVPMYNEEERILPTLKNLLRFFQKHKISHEIILVNDGSKDNTLNMVRKFNAEKNNQFKIIENKGNRGKGYTVKHGALEARGKYILFTDADSSTPIEEALKFLKNIEKYDIVIASRNLKESKIITRQGFFRKMLGKIFPIIVRILTRTKIKDTQCGFKMFKNKVIKNIVSKQTIDRWAFDVELLYIAKKNNYSIKELPVKWINAEGSKLESFKDSIRMLRDVLKILMNDITGKYN